MCFFVAPERRVARSRRYQVGATTGRGEESPFACASLKPRPPVGSRVPARARAPMTNKIVTRTTTAVVSSHEHNLPTYLLMDHGRYLEHLCLVGLNSALAADITEDRTDSATGTHNTLKTPPPPCSPTPPRRFRASASTTTTRGGFSAWGSPSPTSSTPR